MIRRPPRSTQSRSSAASDVYKRQSQRSLIACRPLDFYGDQWRRIVDPRARGEDMEWARTLAHNTGTVDQELLLRNEYLVAENRILKAQLKERLRLSDAERAKLGEIGHRLVARFIQIEG